MKKFILAMAVFIIIFVPPVFSGDFSAFDHKYCKIIDDTKYCVEFQQQPFGPGYVGEAFLISSPANAIWGPMPEETAGLGSVNSRDGITVHFEELGLKGRFDEFGLDIFNLLLRFKTEQ